MGNVIVGLSYKPINKSENEDELMDVFYDLREEYRRLSEQFRIEAEGNPIANFSDFLGFAVRGAKLNLRGSGDIGGLLVENANVSYDLTEVGKLIKYWDIWRDGGRFSCRNFARRIIDVGESEQICAVDGHILTNCSPDCKDYFALKPRDKSGQPARKLEVLIAEASK